MLEAKKKYLSLAILLLIIIMLLLWRFLGPHSYSKTEFLLDTVVEIKAYGYQPESAVTAAFSEINRLQSIFDRYNANSDISLINVEAGRHPVIVSKDLIGLLIRSQNFSRESGGSFDVTVGPLVDLWDIGHNDATLPSSKEIAEVLPLIDYNQIVIDASNNSVYLTQPRMKLDLGGVGKGYAVDRAIEILRAEGIESALVNAGGDIRVIGNRPDGQPWCVGVQDPRNPDKVIASVTLNHWDTAETSGDYQRYFELDGIRYAHIFDPKSGVQPRLFSSVTILADNSVDADFLSTALFVMPYEQGMILARKFSVAVIWVTVEGQILINSDYPNDIQN